MTQLNHRVLVEQPPVSVDSVGQPLPTAPWVSLGKRWADVKGLSGLGVIRADAAASVVKVSVRFNFGVTLAAGMRITHDGAAFIVQAVLPSSDRRYVDCACEAVR